MEHKTLEQSTTSKDSNANSEYDLIDFYLQPEFLQIICQQLAGQSAVDPQKVAQIQQAISNRCLNTDQLSLAAKIISFESELFGSSNIVKK